MFSLQGHAQLGCSLVFIQMAVPGRTTLLPRVSLLCSARGIVVFALVGLRKQQRPIEEHLQQHQQQLLLSFRLTANL
jgi:hypothetical protein